MNSTAEVEREAAVFEHADDRLLILREAQADPAFGRLLAAMLRAPDGEEAVATFAKCAILNELDPGQHPETHGYWPVLRRAARTLVKELPAAMRASRPAALHGLGDLGQFEIIGSLITAAAGAYGAYTTTSTQRQIAQIQADAQRQQLQTQMAIANAQAAMARAQAQQASEASFVPAAVAQPLQAAVTALQSDVAGVPVWMLGLGLYLSFKQQKR